MRLVLLIVVACAWHIASALHTLLCNSRVGVAAGAGFEVLPKHADSASKTPHQVFSRPMWAAGKEPRSLEPNRSRATGTKIYVCAGPKATLSFNNADLDIIALQLKTLPSSVTPLPLPAADVVAELAGYSTPEIRNATYGKRLMSDMASRWAHNTGRLSTLLTAVLLLSSGIKLLHIKVASAAQVVACLTVALPQLMERAQTCVMAIGMALYCIHQHATNENACADVGWGYRARLHRYIFSNRPHHYKAQAVTPKDTCMHQARHHQSTPDGGWALPHEATRQTRSW